MRIKEITENDDRTLSIVAEEYLQGTGAAPEYGHQAPAGYVPNYNLAPGNALAPIMLDAPVQVGATLNMETLLCTNGGPLWGGCDIWISADNVSFKYAGTMQGGTAMGVTTASFPIGSDPDTTDTLAVDLTQSRGNLLPGSQNDADQGHTLCLVDQELVTYEQASLTAQYKYNLGKNGSSAGYLRRGFYGTTIASHASGAPFARLREGSYFTIGYSAAQVGQTIYVKLLSFNLWGGSRQSLDAVSSYPHTLAAPPVPTSGLLSGIIQTPDIALDAATNQVAVSVAGPVSLNPPGPGVDVASASITTIGGTVQLAVNLTLANADASVTQLFLYEVIRDGGAWAVGAALSVPPSSSQVVSRQLTDLPAAGAHTYQVYVALNTATTATDTASTIDLQATEIRR